MEGVVGKAKGRAYREWETTDKAAKAVFEGPGARLEVLEAICKDLEEGMKDLNVLLDGEGIE